MGDVKEQLEGSGQLIRSRHHTDDSSLGSFKYEDMESTEHDGDVEDMSEGDGDEGEEGGSWGGEAEGTRPLYYPAHEDTNSDYTVNAMDAEELRRSVRRSGAGGRRPDLLPDAAQSVSGSQSDDDASTPTGELSDRKLTGSTETLHLLSRREKVLKNTFESLSGAEMDKEPSPKTKSTLSSRHVLSTGVSTRNSQLIEAARHARHDAQASGRREELQRRIEETRRQLQCVGYRSNLESSQSIQDLSPRGMSYHDNRKVQPQKNSFQVPKIDNDYRSASRANHLSLPQSPVYDNTLTDARQGRRASDMRHKQHSYGYFIDIGAGFSDVTKEGSKSLESPSEVRQSVDVSIEEGKSDLSEFSSDSLESCAEFVSGKVPRRCVSEYHIFNSGSILVKDKPQFHSEENMLAVEGAGSGEEGEGGPSGRHSSASFFLRRTDARRSTESILTDESEYQYLFSGHDPDLCDRDRYHSTDSMLTDASDSISRDHVANKRLVMRTRSLQDSAEFKANDDLMDRLESNCDSIDPGYNKPKQEFFFIPIEGGGIKTPPDDIARRFRSKDSSAYRHDSHPIVSHKPPKPYQKLNKPQHKSWQKVPIDTVNKQIAGVKARAAVWKKDKDLGSVWSDNSDKDPGLNSVRYDFKNNLCDEKSVNSIGLQILKCRRHDIICRELKPLELIVKEVIIDDISCAKNCDFNNSSNISIDNNESPSSCQKVNNSTVNNKTLEEDKRINYSQIDSIYETKKGNPVNFTKTESVREKLRPKMPNVKLLSQNFEMICMKGEGGGRVEGEESYDSGSSTPATSSSCTNSPKRLTKNNRLQSEPARRLNNLQHSLHHTLLPSKYSPVVQADLSGGIRRSCSLSDLANFPNKQRSTTRPTTGSVAPANSLHVKSSSSGASRHGSAAIRRSTSVGTLNQSDSESEQSQGRGGGMRRMMRPTISSLNKAISGQKSSTSNRRRPISNSYSTMALNKHNLEDSSSEDGKTNRMTQPRSSSTERNVGVSGRWLKHGGSERDLSTACGPSRLAKGQRAAAAAMVRSTSNLEDTSSNASLSLDFENTPVPELLNYMRQEMSAVGRHMAQVQRRLAAESAGDWAHTFHQTITEHIKSIRRLDPDNSH